MKWNRKIDTHTHCISIDNAIWRALIPQDFFSFMYTIFSIFFFHHYCLRAINRICYLPNTALWHEYIRNGACTIDVDCLMKLFSYSSLDDLYAAKRTHPRFSEPANRVSRKKYDGGHFEFILLSFETPQKNDWHNLVRPWSRFQWKYGLLLRRKNCAKDFCGYIAVLH